MKSTTIGFIIFLIFIALCTGPVFAHFHTGITNKTVNNIIVTSYQVRKFGIPLYSSKRDFSLGSGQANPLLSQFALLAPFGPTTVEVTFKDYEDELITLMCRADFVYFDSLGYIGSVQIKSSPDGYELECG